SHPRQAENIQGMISTRGKKPWEQINLVEVYLVTVRNVGNIPAPLADVGVITESGEKEHALVTKHHSSWYHLHTVTDSGMEAIEPKGSRTFSIYLRREQPMFKATSAYATDQTGKSWSYRA